MPITEEPVLSPRVMEFVHNMDMIYPEYSFDGFRWHSYLDTKVKTINLINQLKKHTATVFIRKKTLGKVIFYSVENVNGKIVVTDRSYTEEPSEQVPKSKLRQQGDWVYAKVGDTEMRGRRDPKGMEFEQVSPTSNREDLDKAVRIIEEFFGEKLPTAIPASFELYNTQYSTKQLQEMAKDAKISPSGLKQDLINRLIQKGVLR